MATQVQFRRGTTAQNSTFTGAVGEITVDTDKDTLLLHDGGTAGGFEIVNVSTAQTLSNKTFSNDIAVNGLTVGKGANALINNTALGRNALDDASLSGNNNVAIGPNTLTVNTEGQGNLAVGPEVLKLNTTGNFNIAMGIYSLDSNTTGSNNTGIGYGSLAANTTASNNIAVGYEALRDNTAANNTALGYRASYKNTTGTDNVALGRNTLEDNLVGNYNTAVGVAALGNNTAANNVAVGYLALFTNTSGTPNTAIGSQALRLNTTGNANVAVGYQALYSNTDASENTAVGYTSLDANTTGTGLTAVGYSAGSANTTGGANTFIGRNAGLLNTTSSNNTYVGRSAGHDATGANNTALGQSALYVSSGANNVALGYQSLFSNTTTSNNVAVGFQALYNQTNPASPNTAVGYQAGLAITTGIYNNLFGSAAGTAITTGSRNVSVGHGGLYSLTVGNYNTSVGHAAGFSVTGSNNTFIGHGAGTNLTTGSNNTLIGDDAEPSSATVSNEITLGNASVTDVRIPGVDFYIDGGNVGIGTSSPQVPLHLWAVDNVGSDVEILRLSGASNGNNEVRMTFYPRDVFMANPSAMIAGRLTLGISGNESGQLEFHTTSGGVLTERMRIAADGTVYTIATYSDTVGGTNRDLYIDDTGKLGYVSSTRASKNNIQDMSDVSWLYSLNPVTFNRRKKEEILDEDNNVIGEGDYLEETYDEKEYGLIAEDVEPVNSDLCFYDKVDGVDELRGVHYHKLITPMLKAIQELSAKVDALQTEINVLKGE